MYVPFRQVPLEDRHAHRLHMSYTLRTVGDPRSLVRAVRQAVADVDPRQPVSKIVPMERLYGIWTDVPRYYMFLLTFFALVAVILASIGVYGVIAYSASQRTHEIGIRMALGANPRDILTMVMRPGLAVAVVGVAVGLGLAVGFARIAYPEVSNVGGDPTGQWLYGVSATDPATSRPVEQPKSIRWWRFGMNRLLLGPSASQDRLFAVCGADSSHCTALSDRLPRCAGRTAEGGPGQTVHVVENWHEGSMIGTGLSPGWGDRQRTFVSRQ